MLGHVKNHLETLNKATEKIKAWQLFIYDDIYTIDEMRLKIKKHRLQTGVDIVFIDYIQNVHGESTLYDRLSNAMSSLQKMAKELQVTVVFVSQVSNEAMRANTEIIGLKGAGELAAAPDIVLWLRRLKGDDKERFLDCEIRKNRPFGETGIYPLMFSDKWSSVESRSL
jgi:replicative DNA helicase